MDPQNQTVGIFALESLLFFLMIVLILRKVDFQERMVRRLVFYTAVSGFWGLYETFWRLGWLAFTGTSDGGLIHFRFYMLLFLALLLLDMTRIFLRLPGGDRRWWILAGVWLTGLILLDNQMLVLPALTWAGRQFSHQEIVFGLLGGGWAIFMTAAAWLTLKTYRQTQQPLHRNRISYWLPVVILPTIGALFLFAGYVLLAINFYLIGTVVAVYVITTHRLPDIRQTARRAIHYVLITLLTVAIYTAGFMAMEYLFRTVPGYNPLLAGAVVALGLVIVSQPLLEFVERLVNALIFSGRYDPTRTLSEYSVSISNILDLERLTTVAMGLIHEAMEIQRGILFVVTQEKETDGPELFQLRGIPGIGTERPPLGLLSVDNPVVDYLRHERRPLTQYDIDLLPHFKQSSEEERTWLANLNMDVYVPIYAKDNWIGLFALGPKLSRDRYFDDDLTLLNTLADQTAVALENARLIEDFKNLNRDLAQAYADLDQANRRLQELDKLKSAFIGVITHELRTPFANIIFSLELIERHGRPHLPEELQDQVDQLGEGIKGAKRMIDNLVTFATFLSKQGQLNPILFDFGQLVEESLVPLQPLAESKQITIHQALAGDLPPVAGDRDRLSDVLYHLIQNAIKFTNPDGQIWIKCRAEAGAIRFEVEDTGIGVPADKLPDLWDGFTQMADPLRRGVEGLGLGLALVKYVVTAHKGQVWAHSEKGVGSTFGFEIPLSSSLSAGTEPTRDNDDWLVEEENDWLVEDEPLDSVVSSG